MSENQNAGTSVMFMSRNGAAQFPAPLPISPWPSYLPAPVPAHRLIMPHASVGLLSLAIHTAAAPMERVHLLLQNQKEISHGLFPPYKGITDCFLRTIKQEGILSMWRGNSVNVFKAFSSQALAFSIMKYSLHNEAENKNDEYGDLKLDAALCSATLLQYPLDYARTRLATDVKASASIRFSLDSSRKNLCQDIGTRQFKGLFDVYIKTLKREGITGLYKGYYLSLFGFVAWDFCYKELLEYHKIQGEMMQPRIAPFAMSCCIPLALYPLTSVSRRMMMDSGDATSKYKNPVHAFRSIVKHEGFRSLYNGATSGMVVCFVRLGVSAAFVPVLHLILP